VEVKNPARAWKLTEAEQKTKDEIESAGGKYYIVETVKDAARVIGWEIV
jgi:L-lactate utilization protein LutB